METSVVYSSLLSGHILLMVSMCLQGHNRYNKQCTQFTVCCSSQQPNINSDCAIYKLSKRCKSKHI
jgi:hypothetical protein